MLGGSLMAFVNVPGLLVVIGGTLAATLINQKLKIVLGAFSVAKNAFVDRATPIEELTATIQELRQTARKEGVLGLEKVDVRDPLLARATNMAIDGMEADFVVSTLKRNLGAIKDRHQRGQQIFRFMATTAPAMGMIGTLIGLVGMLQTLDDPAAIGPAMAVALLTTFYGALLAFLVFGPIAEKLEARNSEEMLRGQYIVAGIEAILNSDEKTKMQASLESYLAPNERKSQEVER